MTESKDTIPLDEMAKQEAAGEQTTEEETPGSVIETVPSKKLRISFKLKGKPKKRQRPCYPNKTANEQRIHQDIRKDKQHINHTNWRDIANAVLLATPEDLAKGIASRPTPPPATSLENALLQAHLQQPKSGNYALDRVKAVRVSLVIYLFQRGFICRNVASSQTNSEGFLQPFSRCSRHFLRSIDMGIMPTDLSTQIPCVFYDGKVIVELHDFRKSCAQTPITTAGFSEILRSQELKPTIRRVLLRPSMELLTATICDQVEKSLEEDQVHRAQKLNIAAEKRLLEVLHPASDMCLEPSTDVCRTASVLFLNSNRFNVANQLREHSYRRLEYATSNIKSLVASPKKPSASKRRKSNASIDLSSERTPKAGARGSSPKVKPPKATSLLGVSRKALQSAKAKPVARSKAKKADLPSKRPSASKKSDGLLNIGGSNAGTSFDADDQWDFISKLLDDTSPTDLSLTSDVSPSNPESLLLLSPERPKGLNRATVPKSLKPTEISSVDWFQAAQKLQHKLETLAKSNLEHVMSAQPLMPDGTGRVGSIVNLARKLGKTLWPTEAIALSRAKNQQIGQTTPQLQLTKSPLRGAELAEARARFQCKSSRV